MSAYLPLDYPVSDDTLRDVCAYLLGEFTSVEIVTGDMLAEALAFGRPGAGRGDHYAATLAAALRDATDEDTMRGALRAAEAMR